LYYHPEEEIMYFLDPKASVEETGVFKRIMVNA
jgi:hypothetical protein